MSNDTNETMKEAANIQIVAALNLQDSVSGISIELGLFSSAMLTVIRGLSLMSHVITDVVTTLHGTLSSSTKNLASEFQKSADTFAKIAGIAISGGGGSTGTPSSGGVVGIMKQAYSGFSLSPKGMLGSLGKGVAGGLGALGPQMLALSLIMKPVAALMEGLTEPLEPLTDLFGMVGSILGLLLVPIVKELMNVLLPFMPLLVEIVMVLMPLIRVSMIPMRLLAITLTTIMPFIISLVGTLSIITVFIETIANFIPNMFSIGMTWVSDGLGMLATIISNWSDEVVSDIKGWFIGIYEDFEDIIEDLKFWEKE